MALPPRGNRMPSHRIHSYCVYSPTDFHSSGGILPPPQQRVSHRIRRSHRSLCWEYSPTDFTEFTELLAECILPQISLLLRIFSHRFHRFAQMVRVHPLKLHLCNLWEDIPSRRFCEFCAICGRIFRTQTICVDLWNLWEVIPSRSNPWEPLRSHLFSPRYKHCVLFRAAHGAWADREQTGSRQVQGENIVRYCTENAAIGAESVIIPPSNV